MPYKKVWANTMAFNVFLIALIVLSTVVLCKSKTYAHEADLSVQVVQKWVNFNGEKIEPLVDGVEVELYKDNEPTGILKQITKGDNWKTSFDNLESGFNYHVRVVGESTADLDGDEINMINFEDAVFQIEYKGNVEEGFEIVSTEQGMTMAVVPETLEEPEIVETKSSSMPIIFKIGIGLMLVASIYVIKKKALG